MGINDISTTMGGRLGSDREEDEFNLRKHKEAVRDCAKACVLLEYRACRAYLEKK